MYEGRSVFAPSPRGELPLGTSLASTERWMAEMSACLRRNANSTRAFVRCSGPAWRWLFLPPYPPLIEESRR